MIKAPTYILYPAKKCKQIVEIHVLEILFCLLLVWFLLSVYQCLRQLLIIKLKKKMCHEHVLVAAISS